jgi:hypothetical protein
MNDNNDLVFNNKNQELIDVDEVYMTYFIKN